MDKSPNQHQTQQPIPHHPDDQINLLEFLLVVAKHNRFILKLTGAAALLALVISLLLPDVYTARVMIMPPQQSQSSAASLLLGQLNAFGALTGIDKSPSGLYISMLKSRTVADALIRRFNLGKVYDVETNAAAREKLADKVTISADKEGMISLEFDDRSASRAAAIANGYIEELDNLVRRLAVTEASRRRLFFEKQLADTRGHLEAAEQAMKEMQEKTGVIELEGQSGSILGAEASLRATIAAKEVELTAMRSFATAQNPDYRQLEQVIAGLRGQLTKLEHSGQGSDGELTSKGMIPERAVEYIHKMRDLKYYEKLFEFISEQLASARLDEAKDAAVIQVVDRALPPEKRSRPMRALIVSLAAMCVMLLGIFWAFFREAGGLQHPVHAERFLLLRRYLFQGN